MRGHKKQVEPLTATLGHPVFSDLYTAEGDPTLSPATVRHPNLYIFKEEGDCRRSRYPSGDVGRGT
jgi:hypothetical protein